MNALKANKLMKRYPEIFRTASKRDVLISIERGHDTVVIRRWRLKRPDSGVLRPVVVFFLILIMLDPSAYGVFENSRPDGPPMMGIPMSAFSSGTSSQEDICPQGEVTINAFMEAWKKEDYAAMYSLLDQPELSGYLLEEVKMDFRFMEYKPYVISSVRQSGDNFEFILSYGDWKDRDKDVRKVLVSGDTFKIVLQKNRSVFKMSIAGGS